MNELAAKPMFNRRNHEKDLLKSVIGASLSLNRNLYGETPNGIGREGKTP